MSFGKLLTVISSLFCGQSLSPTKCADYFWLTINNFFVGIWQGVCSLFYWLCKWLLAVVDFLQYFIQKLIGLDYWLKPGSKTWSGAIKNDILFSFLYNDTVQRVFRAMVGVFIVLLIVFTIVQIVRQEWQYITGNNFGDGKSNSKAEIMRRSMKAFALVLIFPMILTVGIISSNSILASLVKALNIDMATTFGGTLFSISAQSANKYRLYASTDNRYAASNKVIFYSSGDQVLLFNGTGTAKDDTTYEKYITDYKEYLRAINSAGVTKHVVDSMIEPINPMKYGKKNPFSGYCFSIPNGDKRKLFMAYCTSSEKDSMRLYLNGVLKVDVLTSSNNFSSEIVKTAKPDANGFISKLELEDQSKGELITACYNTWSYSTIYNLSDSFSDTLQYQVVKSSDLTGKYNIDSVSTAKLIYNSDQISSYFDGGQTGFVQMQSEYNVMADVVDFMNDKQTTLYMLDITSSLIDWSYSDSVNGSNYQVDSKWLGSGDVDVGERYKPFIVSYSEECSDTETGNVLYLAKASAGSELEGSKYIMCWKVVSGGQTKFVPLVNGKSFKDPDTMQSYTFKSDYLESSYRGVILAKGLLDANSGGSTNKKVGEPTYIQSDIYKEDGSSAISVDKPYYYDLKQEGYLLQYATDVSTSTQGGYSVATIQFSSEYSSEGYSTNTKDLGSGDKIIQLIQDSDVKSFTDDIIKNLTINMQTGTEGVSATYAGIERSQSNSKLYLFKAGYLGYFVVEWDSVVNGIRIKSLSGSTIAEKGATTGITITKPTYDINYVYDYNGSSANGTLITGITPEDFEYSSTDGDYSLFQTTDRQTVSFGGVTKTMYVNAFFNTDGSALMSFGTNGMGQNVVYYADGLGNTVGTANEKYTQKTEFYRVDLYNYLTGVADGGLYEYDIETKQVSTSAVSAPDASDNEFVKKFNMNATDFKWDKNAESIALYDGKNYVATLYKPYGNDANLGYPSGTSSISDFFNSKSIKILIDGNEYYNIRTQNTFTDKLSMKNYYTNSLSDLRIGFYRDNLDDIVFLKVDFNFSLVGNMRFYLRAFLREMDTINTNSFELYDGISFDYFFDGDIDLYDFYVPSKISYWIILIASALIIKVLGNALWGVIKRFYEITMYFIAMPAVASTIPLDDGDRFNKQIQTPLISKVLSTYGVILGINVFFILLAPVKSISQIFTVEDIETSGSYFLKHLPIPVKWLNNYVYILFVLVAFTMINALPKTISGLIGAGEVSADGATAKETSAKQMKSAGDIISGRAGMNAIGDLGKKATGMIPFSEPAKRAAGKVGGGIKNIFDKTKDKDESSGGGSSRSSGGSESGSSRADGEGESGEGSGNAENAMNVDSSQMAEAVGEGVASSRAGTDVPAETDPMNSVAMENATTTTASDGTTAVADGSGAGGVLNSDAKESVMGEVKADAVGSAVEAVQANNAENAENANGDVEVVAENLAEEKAEQATEQSTEIIDQNIDAKTEEKADEKIGESKPKTLADEIKEKSDKQVNFIKALPETVGNAVSKFGNVLSKPFVAAGKGIATGAKDVGNKLTNSKAGRAVMSGALVAKEKTSEFATRVSNAVSGLPVVSSINKKLHRSRNVSAGVADEETTVPVNSHNEIHIASSLTGKGATGKGRTSGQIIAKAIEEGRDLTAEQIEGITVSEFNEQAISDQNFIDNKTSARANVIRNKVGTKIGRQVTAEVLSTYAETEIDPQLAGASSSKKIATAIVGGNGKKGLLTQAMKTELVKSTMTKSELENFEQLSSAEQAKVVSKYKTSAIVKADGAIGFAVADDKGKVNVNQKTADKVVSQMLSSESVKDSAIETAIEKTGAKENVDLALSQNIASGINFNKENASSATSMMANAVYERASQNDDIVAEAMLRHIESSKTSNPALYSRFQSEFNLGDADLGDSVTRGRVIEQIKMFNKSDNANVINTMSKDSYANEFTGLVQEKVNDGSFKVTAWQIADDESKEEFSAKTATNLKNITNTSILDGATQSEKVNIIANTATNLMSQRGDTAESRKIQDTAFIKNVSNQELRSLDQETLSNLVGRSVEVEDLTAEDKAFLGFVKARNGGSFAGVNTDAVSVSKYRNASMNGSARINAFNSLSNNIKANAVIENNKQDVYAQIATQDATYAMTKESLVKVQASYAQGMKNSPEKQELDRMFKQFTGKDDASITTASAKQLANFFTTNNKASNIVTSQMRESGVDFNAYVNRNYKPTFTRTSEEQKAEYNMSVVAVKKNAPASIYNAFVTSDIENKDILANQMFAQYANIENVNSDVYKGAISDMKANNVNIDALIMRGNSETNIVMAYKKAQMMGDIGINGSGANEDVINEYLNLTMSQTNQMLRQMQNLSAEQHSALFAGGASYEKVANTLANDRITEGQKSALIETAAKSGYKAMSEKEQVAIVENLGMKDGEIRDNATIAKYLNTNQTEFSRNMSELTADDKDKILALAKTNNISANDKDVREYLASNNGRDDKERLENKANKMSYYEIDSTINGDATSEQVYETIKGQVSKSQQVEELYQRQGDLIDNESVQRTIAESGDVVASDYVASAYAGKINTISKSEEQDIRVNAEYSALDAETIASIRGSKEATIESAKTRALYTEFMSNDRYSAYISSIRKSDEYKAESKKEGFNAETYITNMMVKMLTAGGLVSDVGARPNRIRIDNISARAEKQAIIAEAVARDSSLGIELESVGNEAVELKNKQRLAFGGANRVNIFADAIKENNNLYKKARIAFRSQKGYEGKELEEVDESTRNNFLANTFANSLSEEEKQTISKSEEQQNREYIKSVLGDDAEEKIKATKSSITGKNFSDINQFILHAEGMGISIDKALEDYGLSGAISTISSGAAKFYNKANEKSGKKFNDLSESERLQKAAEYEYAKKLYEEENASKGLKFENASFEKKAIMLNGFSENQSKQAIHEYLNSSIVKNMSKSDFNEIYESSKHENYGEESSVFKNVKKGIISKQLDDSSEIDRIEKTISRNDSSVIELARTDATVVAKLGENASDKNISKFLSANTKLANSLKRTVAENMFIEQTLGATFEGQDVSMLSADQRATALTLARSSKITIGTDVSKLTGKEKRDYEYRRNIIQQEIRNDSNPQILANTFKNTTLVNESKIVSDMVGGNTQADILKNKIALLKNNEEFMAKTYGLILNSNNKNSVTVKEAIVSDFEKNSGRKYDSLSVSEKNSILAKYMQNAEFIKSNNLTKSVEKVNASFNSEISKYAMKATSTELKQGLSEEQINSYLKSHENIKDQLVSIAASDVSLTLDKETQSARKIDAVMSNTALQRQTAVQMMKEQFNSSEIYGEIVKMLTNSSSKFYDAKFASELNKISESKDQDTFARNYINKDYSEMLSKVSTETYYEYNKQGQARLKETVKGQDVADSMNKAINTLSENSKLYNDIVNGLVTRVIDPAHRATDAEKANFFASTNTKTANKQLQDLSYNFSSVRNTMTNFYKVNAGGESEFAGFFNASTSAVPNGVYTNNNNVVKIENGEFKSAIYKQKRNLPETSKKYDEWNANLQKEIDKAKRGKGVYEGMSRSQREAHVQDLEARKIRTTLPDNFAIMTNEDQIKFRKAQNALKNEALNVNFSKLIKNVQKYGAPSKKAGREFVKENGQKLTRKEVKTETEIVKHKQTLADIESSITRFNATKAMRNKNVDFGSNFNKFASNYLSEKDLDKLTDKINKKFAEQTKGQVDNLGRTITQKSMPKFADMNDSQKRTMINIREEALKEELNKEHKVALKKVKNDSLKKGTSLTDDTVRDVRYKNATPKFTHQHGRLNKVVEEYNKQYRENNGVVEPKVKKAYDKMYGTGGIESKVKKQNELISLKTQYDKVVAFNNSFKGDKSEYRRQLQELLGDSQIVNNVYRRYGALFGSGEKGPFSLANSPVAVQKNEIANGIMRQLRNAEYRLNGKYKGYIPANSQSNTEYVGKAFTNARKQVEMDNTKRVAGELNSALKQFNTNSKSLSYDQLYSMLKPYMRDSFKAGKRKDFVTYSDETKKELLRKHLENSLTKANNRVNNDSFFGSDKAKLMKLNGTYIERKDVNTGTTSRIVGSEVYQNLVKNFNNAKTKVDLEQLNIDRLSRTLKEKMSGPQNLQTRREINNLRQSLEASRIRMKTYRSIYDDAGSKKRSFEQAYASKQIAQAKGVNDSIKYHATANKALFDNYKFPIKPKPGDPMDPRFVRPGTPDAKMVENAIGRFIMRYKNQMQMMVKSMVRPELKDLNNYISNVANKLTDDFGKNVSDLRRTERKLKEELKKLSNKTDRKSLQMKEQIETSLQQLKANEKDLIQKLDSMGIDIKEIQATK